MRSPIFKASSGDRLAILDCIELSANEIPDTRVSRIDKIDIRRAFGAGRMGDRQL
jgi:hypothetical protein